MVEYIEREEAKAILDEYIIDHPLFTDRDAARAVQEKLEAIPAADVVEVVRCRECVEWQSGWKPSGVKEGTHFCAVTGLCKEANWFCADGERKDGGQDDGT